MIDRAGMRPPAVPLWWMCANGCLDPKIPAHNSARAVANDHRATGGAGATGGTGAEEDRGGGPPRRR